MVTLIRPQCVQTNKKNDRNCQVHNCWPKIIASPTFGLKRHIHCLTYVLVLSRGKIFPNLDRLLAGFECNSINPFFLVRESVEKWKNVDLIHMTAHNHGSGIYSRTILSMKQRANYPFFHAQPPSEEGSPCKGNTHLQKRPWWSSLELEFNAPSKFRFSEAPMNTLSLASTTVRIYLSVTRIWARKSSTPIWRTECS